MIFPTFTDPEVKKESSETGQATASLLTAPPFPLVRCGHPPPTPFCLAGGGASGPTKKSMRCYRALPLETADLRFAEQRLENATCDEVALVWILEN